MSPKRRPEEKIMSAPQPHLGLAGRVARVFIDSKLTPLIIIASVLLGAFAVIMLPREEEPQIKVPMIDVLVAMPGFSAKEVGHMSPSSRFAVSSKPSVAYRASNLSAAWKKQTILPSLA